MSPAESHVIAAGCPRLHELIRVRVPGPPADTRANRSLSFTCPRCGEEHQSLDIYGRPDDGRLAVDVDLCGAEPVESGPATPERPAEALRGRQTVSDAAILAALPEDGTAVSAIKVAASIGYGGGKPGPALVARLRRNPERWRNVEIIVGGGHHSPTLLRRRR